MKTEDEIQVEQPMDQGARIEQLLLSLKPRLVDWLTQTIPCVRADMIVRLCSQSHRRMIVFLDALVESEATKIGAFPFFSRGWVQWLTTNFTLDFSETLVASDAEIARICDERTEVALDSLKRLFDINVTDKQARGYEG